MPKITELNAITTVANNDLLMVVHDPAGLPSTNKITVNNFISSVGTQLRGYTGSVGAASAIGYTGSVGVGYAGSAGPAGTSGFTGSAGTGYTGSVGVGYAGSAGDSINSAQGNNGFLPVSTGSNTYVWKANPDVRSYKLITNDYQATLDDSVLSVDPSVNLTSITIFLPNTAPNGKVFGVENKFNYGSQAYIVQVKKTDLTTTVEDPITNQLVSTVTLADTSEGYFWIYEDGDYKILHNMHTSRVFYASANTYKQVALQNINAGPASSGDFVIYNDQGDYTQGTGPFIDMGINSSNYTDTYYGNVWSLNDGYLYNTGGNLIVGPQTDHSILLIAGNTNTNDIKLVVNSTSVFSNTNFIPTQNNIFSLGSANKQWKELWVSNNTIYIGGVPVTVDAGGMLTVNGVSSVGYTGSAGSAGTNGYTGSEGAAGTTGYTGSEGMAGSAGTTGYTGSEGAGYTGSQGAIGFTGSIGSLGYTGSEGIGYAGSAGSLGYSGSQGDLGYTGSVGAGYAGSQGDLGYTGSEGAIGFTGSAGGGGSTGEFIFTTNNSIELAGANTLYIVDNWSSGVELVSNLSVQLTWADTVDSIGYNGNTAYFYLNSSGAYIDLYDGITSKTWTFDNLGAITFPDLTVQNTAFTFTANSSNWSAPAPTTLDDAIDRLAILVKSLNSGTGA